jgi:hypothetical protein
MFSSDTNLVIILMEGEGLYLVIFGMINSQVRMLGSQDNCSQH